MTTEPANNTEDRFARGARIQALLDPGLTDGLRHAPGFGVLPAENGRQVAWALR
jgi:hypothetical protein